jgi:hypothetical protein
MQAACLVPAHPRVPLSLLDQYFALKEPFDQAAAFVSRAEAFLALDDPDSAIDAFRAALAHERLFFQTLKPTRF